MRLVSLDPGGTTGVCIYSDDAGMPAMQTSELKGQHHQDLYELLTDTWWDAVIYERFLYQRRELTKGVSLVLDSVEYIGVIKLAHEKLGRDVKLVEQTPAQAKNLWTDDKLRKLNLWVSSPHERDATRHMLYYLVVTLGQRNWLDALKPS